MKIQLCSRTKAGKWAANLTLLFIVFMVLKFFTLGISIQLPLPTPFIAVLGVVGLIFGVVSFVKNKDRAILTLLSILMGLLVILWVSGEIAFPH